MAILNFVKPGTFLTGTIVAANSVDKIHCSHALEHISKYQVKDTLKEWYRVLKIGGEIEIKVPDLRWLCENWLRKQNAGWDLDAIYGMQNHPGEQHRTGFSPKILEGYVVEAGFVVLSNNIIWSHNMDTIHLYGGKE